MAVIHISETEAARNLPSLLERVRAGEEVFIDDATSTIAVLHAPSAHAKPRRISEVLAVLEARGSSATLDPGFAADVEDGIRSREHETLRDPWE